jgi:PAS domain S-box-containing protein
LSDEVRAGAHDTLQTLQESDEVFCGLIEAAPDAIVITSSDGRILLVNHQAEKLFGYKRDELFDQAVEVLLPERFRLVHVEHRLNFFSNPRTRPMGIGLDLTGRHKHGSEFPVEISLSPLMTPEGTLVISNVRDITERRRAEEAVQKGEEQFRKIFDHSNDAIFVIDPDRDAIIDANPKACEMLGYSLQELLSLRISAIHPDEMPELMAFAHSVFDRGHGWTDELTCRTKNGNSLPAEISASIVEIGGQDLMIALIRDTAERKEAEERIRREAARADALAHAAARLNAHLTLDAVLDAVCEEAARALDVPAAAVLMYNEDGATLSPAATFGLPPEYREDYAPNPRALYDKYAQQQGPLIIAHDAQDRPDLPNAQLYTRYDIRTSVIASLTREGQLIGTLNVYSLGEPRTFGNDELAPLTGLADQAAQAIENAQLRQQSELAAVMEERGRLARELHDSVTQSLYSLTLLAEGYQRSARAGRLERPEESLIELGEIAQQALKEMRLLVHQLRPLALQREGLLSALHQRLSAVEKRAGVEARLVAEDVVELPPPVEEALYRIAQEALNNALKHATATSVTVYFRADDGRVELDVVDDGRGFNPSTIDEQRGMGLVSMRERAEKLGGSLTIDSAPGEGTKVKVSMGTRRSS